MQEQSLREVVASHPLWYHTMELAPGVVTPGWFDTRSVLPILPWPEIKGRRCLDIGTYDGILAFELERRGASEVTAIDIADHRDWDWPPDVRATGPENLAKLAGPEKGRGFEIAAEAFGSRVERKRMSVYDLTPDEIGTFDVVVCGSLMLHLRDPIRALEAIRRVCSGWFLSIEEVNFPMTVRHRRRPIHLLNGTGPLLQWWVPNAEGHRRMVFAAGFEVVRWTKPFVESFGVSHPRPGGTFRESIHLLVQRVLTGKVGVWHAALLARPRV